MSVNKLKMSFYFEKEENYCTITKFSMKLGKESAWKALKLVNSQFNVMELLMRTFIQLWLITSNMFNIDIII